MAAGVRTERQQARHRRIADAAYALLQTEGYRATSMLAIARQAGASNETLYRWYGNKQGLFRTLVEDNAAGVRDLLQARLSGDAQPLDTLSEIAPLLLQLVTGDRAVALNRAAAADVNDTATLGSTIAESGRGTVVPLIGAQIARLQETRELSGGTVAEMAETFVGLLIGDLQIRRVIGVIDPPDSAECERRARRAISQLVRLYGPDHSAATGAAAIAPD